MKKEAKMSELKFTRKMQKKLAVLFIIIMLALIALVGRLAYINKNDGERYSKQVLAHQNYNSQTIVAKRGDIVDRKGTVLATSEEVYNVILDCKVMTTSAKGECVEPTIEALVKCFGADAAEVRDYVTKNPTSQYYVLMKRVPYEQMLAFQDMVDQEKNGKKVNPYIKGVWFEKEYTRKYSYGSLASDLLGFTLGTGTQGMFGIEEYYNSYLTGTNGREYGYLNSDSDLERTVKEPVNGNTIVSTIDVNIQQIVEKHIAEFNEEYKNNFREGDGAENIGVIIANPNNGEILAMASSPVFDLNDPKNFEGLEGLTDEEATEVMNQRWKNFCISENYEPGSTAKPYTVAAGIESGKMTGNETYYCDGYQEIGGHRIRCVNRNGHGMETIAKAISNSCNDALMQMASQIGKAEFCKYQSIFNLGAKTGIDLPGEESGLLYTEDKMGPADLATNSFGQNFNVNMVQMVAGISSLINGGYYYQPHVVKKINSANGGTVESMDGKLIRQTISASTSEKIKSYLYETVQNGTGKAAKVPGYSMGGKTGTAERAGRDKTNYLVSFIGYAPADKPEVLFYVVIDRPNVEKQSSSRYAMELSKKIMTEVLPYMNIFQDQEYTTEELKEMSEGQLTVTPGASGAPEVSLTPGASGTPEVSLTPGASGTPETSGTPTPTNEPDPYYDPETGDNLDPNFSTMEDGTTTGDVTGTPTQSVAPTPEGAQPTATVAP